MILILVFFLLYKNNLYLTQYNKFSSSNIFEERDEFPFSKMINLYRDKPFKLFAEYGSREIPHSVRQIGNTYKSRNMVPLAMIK